MDRSDLELVTAVRDHGSLVAAANSLDVAAPVVSKRLAALEARLGQKLFARTTRRVSPTPEGEALCERAAALLQGFAALEADLQERQAEPAGLIRLAGTLGFGRLWLGPALARFQALHPRINIQLHLSEQLPDLAMSGFDGAIWLWSVRSRRAAQWVTRRLAHNQRVLVASPAYLARHGTPTSAEELAQHACLIVRENGDAGSGEKPGAGQGFDTWTLQSSGDRHADKNTASPVRLRVSGPLSSNSGELVRDWCLAGHGIMLRSLWDIAPHLASGSLIRVLPQLAMPDADIHWLAPQRTHTPRRIRLLLDFLVAEFAGAPWQEAGARLP